MTYVITKTFKFAASHQLTGLPAGHKCRRLHGHNYLVTVALTSPVLDGAGMLLDYDVLSGTFGEWLKQAVDHRHLGAGNVYDYQGVLTDPAVFEFNPTAEHLAAEFLARARELVPQPVAWVEVKETEATSAVASS